MTVWNIKTTPFPKIRLLVLKFQLFYSISFSLIMICRIQLLVVLDSLVLFYVHNSSDLVLHVRVKFWLGLGHDSILVPHQNMKIPSKCSKYNLDMVTHMDHKRDKKFSFYKRDTFCKALYIVNITQLSHLPYISVRVILEWHNQSDIYIFIKRYITKNCLTLL